MEYIDEVNESGTRGKPLNWGFFDPVTGIRFLSVIESRQWKEFGVTESYREYIVTHRR